MCLCLIVNGLLVLRNDYSMLQSVLSFFFFQAEDGIRDLVRSRGLGDVYKRQPVYWPDTAATSSCHNAHWET